MHSLQFDFAITVKVINAGAAVTLPFVFESTSPIQPIVVEVKPEETKEKPELPPRQTKPWLGDMVVADDQGEIKPVSVFSHFLKNK